MHEPTRAATGDPLSERWSIDDARELYQVSAWSAGYFDVSADGHLLVRPRPGEDASIDLYEVVEGLRERGIATPVVLRFSDILAHRLQVLHEAFARAIRENEYEGAYRSVYPIKVNQQRPVVEEVFRSGEPWQVGLEVGSKPELLAVMALTAEAPDRMIVCNGFKDSAYIEAVILATKLGRHIIPVVENFGELHLILEHAARYQVRPRIGVRVKLAARGAGRWRDSAGARSKFGLTTTELVRLVDTLREHGCLDALRLVHCHAGSQLQDIRRIKDAVAELAHVYAELRRLGAPVEYLDVGGGLGVDYDGSQTNFSSSMNYTAQEYASEIVYRIASVCEEKQVPHPTIVSESGRAVAAYHSVIVFDVLGCTSHATEAPAPEELFDDDEEDVPQPLRDLQEAFTSVSGRRLLECYHDAIEARRQAMDLFKLGYLTLEQRALAERLFWGTCTRVRDLVRQLESVPEELEPLELILSETYFCNLSVFQSLPDVWAIGQLFPVMPIHRLEEPPTRRAVLADITCDSDGRIDRFTDVRDVRRALEVHELREGERYYLAAFLVGAYQETLGDLHNLFGDTHVVHLRLHESDGWWIDQVVEGNTAAEVLGYVQYEPRALLRRLSEDCERAVHAGRLKVAERRALLRFYESELAGYTYLVEE